MIKLFTHTDLDGIGCSVLAELAYGKDNVDIEYCGYDNIDDKVMAYIDSKEWHKYEFCFITDISVSDKIAQLIEKETIDCDTHCNHIQLLDHHKTALDLNKYWWCRVKEFNGEAFKTSGTELFYEWLIVNDKLPPTPQLHSFVALVTNYDTWRWTTLGEDGEICKQVNDLLYLYGRDKFITWAKSQLHDGVFPRLYEKDKLVLRLKQREIDGYIESKNKSMIKTTIQGYVAGVVFADRYQSELGNELCKLNDDIDFVAIVNIDKSISYRTVKDVDVSNIAAEYGGGGHPKASGSGVDLALKGLITNLIFG